MMPSIFVLLLFLVSCLSMHMYACNARRALGFSTVEESGSQVHHSANEGVEKVLTKLSEISSTKSSTRSTRRSSISSVEAETVVIHDEKASSGADIISLSTPQNDHEQKSIKMKGLKRQARSLLGSAAQDNDMKEDHNTDSVGNSNEVAIDEDVGGVMDYENPHRKPPIHNQKP